MSTDFEMLNNLKYSNEIAEQLSLNEQQLYALNADCFREMLPEKVAKAIGVTDAAFAEWQSNPFWRVCFHIRDDVSSFVSCLDAVQAGFLASIGVAYKEIELLIGLPDGQLYQWLKEDLEWDEGPEKCKRQAFMAAESALWYLKRDAIQYGMPDKQRQALPLILAGKTDKEVGELVGVCRETVSDWKRGDDFKFMLEAERERLVVANRERLGTLFEQACCRASELMNSSDERISCQATLGVLKTLKDVALPVQSASQQGGSVDAHVLLGMLSQLGALKGLPNPK